MTPSEPAAAGSEAKAVIGTATDLQPAVKQPAITTDQYAHMTKMSLYVPACFCAGNDRLAVAR